MLKSGKALCAVTQNMASDDAKKMIDLGVTALMVASDQGFVRSGALSQLEQFRSSETWSDRDRLVNPERPREEALNRRAAEGPPCARTRFSRPAIEGLLSGRSVQIPSSSIGLREIILWMSSSE